MFHFILLVHLILHMPLLNLIHQVLLKRVIVRLSFERFSLNRVADFEILSLLCLGDKSCNELVFFELKNIFVTKSLVWNYNFCLDSLEGNMPVKEGRWKLRNLWGAWNGIKHMPKFLHRVFYTTAAFGFLQPTNM